MVTSNYSELKKVLSITVSMHVNWYFTNSWSIL